MSLLVIGPLSTFKIDMPLVNNHTIYGAMLGIHIPVKFHNISLANKT